MGTGKCGLGTQPASPHANPSVTHPPFHRQNACKITELSSGVLLESNQAWHARRFLPKRQ